LGVEKLPRPPLAAAAPEDVLENGQVLVIGRGEELLDQEVMGVNLHGLDPP
jgi:hypothetical protein